MYLSESFWVLWSRTGVSNLLPEGHMQPRMAMNEAQHKTSIYLKYYLVLLLNAILTFIT